MKFLKINPLWALVFILFIVMLGSNNRLTVASSEGTKDSSLQQVQAEFVSCYTSFLGAESISLVPMIRLTNPNPYLVSIKLSYLLKADEENFAGSQLPELYIPANASVTVRDNITISYFSLFAAKALGGKTPGETVAVLLPIWKGLGGKTPAKVKKESWEKIKPKSPVFLMDLEITASNGGQEANFFTKETWSEK